MPCTARRSNQFILKEINPEYWKDWCGSWKSNALATWCEELIHLERPWCWQTMMVRGEGDDRGWDGWMASPTQWTWVWVGSRSWWWTGKPDVLQSMGCKELDMTEQLNWTPISCKSGPITETPYPFLYLASYTAADPGSILGQEDLLENKMATHSSILAWKIPWTEEPGRLQSMGSQRVGHDWVTSLSLFCGINRIQLQLYSPIMCQFTVVGFCSSLGE